MIVGVDLSPAMVALARTLQPALEFREADAAALPFPAGPPPFRYASDAALAELLGSAGLVDVTGSCTMAPAS